ncbi:MgtC/SapB family protein [Mesorhizobium sp. ORS 3428]|uniref:MgtC/SapB family protein n=1 Tax=Mesorhizobium sp. ORS 3428 TaxID=540997 RepID=UPI0008DAE241|nr:MgtC/SapB family protein [Mesorhizobium sp. ORS 3428]OHV89332.1 ATPase [Mesorhizobium sp. ORS 3428]
MLQSLCCDMPLHPTALDLVGRLLLTLLAGFLIGLNREARGHSAGLRTTILVGLAACVAMVQGNMLLGMIGKGPDTFVRMDVMRFALGVLTGVGFIGGGAILRRGDLVTGVTTAATMWIMTMIGLAFGGGQFGLGAIATVLTLVTLQTLKWVDLKISRAHKAILSVSWPKNSPPDIADIVRPLGYDARFVGMEHDVGRSCFVFSFNVQWKQPDAVEPSTDILAVIAEHCAVERFEVIGEKPF